MKQACTHAILCLAILAPFCVRAFALDPSLAVSPYAHTAWKIRDGFAKDQINAIAQTPDGYLWLGTGFGLLRFDGVRAAPWQPPNGEQLPSNFVTSMFLSHDDTLWIGTLKGLASWKDGKLTQHPEVAGVQLGSFLEDREQTVWFGTWETSKARLCAIRDGKVECYGPGTFGNFVSPVCQDHKGNLWVSGNTGLWRWAPGPPERYPLPNGVTQATAAVEDDSGDLLLSTNDGLKRLVAGKIEDYRLPGITGHFGSYRLLRSRDGSLWISTTQGLLHMHHGKVDRFSAVDGLSGDSVSKVSEDREGSVWVITQNGLDRFHEYAIPTISRNQGLSNSGTWAVQATPDGSVWIGTAEGLNRWENGRMTVYRGQRALGQSRTGEEPGPNTGAAAEVANRGLLGSPRSLGLDDAARLWASMAMVLLFPKAVDLVRHSRRRIFHRRRWTRQRMILNGTAASFIGLPTLPFSRLWAQFAQNPQTML
jgi:ligand-binding sensor domain-containing protein